MSFKLIKNATIIDPNSTHHNKIRDILIENGTIAEISESINSKNNYLIIEEANLHICPGLMDFSVDFSDPGNEQKETITSGSKAAISGGFTAIGLQPTDSPARDNKGAIKYCTDSGNELGINVYPFGALSKGLEGNQLAEMYDMNKVGALAFTDYKRPFLAVQNVRNLKRSNPYKCTTIHETYFNLFFHKKKFVTGKLLKCD